MEWVSSGSLISLIHQKRFFSRHSSKIDRVKFVKFSQGKDALCQDGDGDEEIGLLSLFFIKINPMTNLWKESFGVADQEHLDIWAADQKHLIQCHVTSLSPVLVDSYTPTQKETRLFLEYIEIGNLIT